MRLVLEHLKCLFDCLAQVEILIVKFKTCIFHFGQIKDIIYQIVYHFIWKSLLVK